MDDFRFRSLDSLSYEMNLIALVEYEVLSRNCAFYRVSINLQEKLSDRYGVLVEVACQCNNICLHFDK